MSEIFDLMAVLCGVFYADLEPSEIEKLFYAKYNIDIDDFEEVVKLDTEYICHWSMANDIKILFRTVQVVALAMLAGKFIRYVVWMYLNGLLI
jgi:propanediol dehydratase large subunit